MRLAHISLCVLCSCGGASGTGASDGPTTFPGTCDPDPLATGLVAQQTGVAVDSFDCPILAWSAQLGEPDPMIFKAIIYVESRFDQTSVACTNLPCGQPTGWSTMEAGCLGLMQIVPACNGTPDNVGLLPDGHPNMTTDMSSAGWATSIFNPDINIHVGSFGLHDNRMQELAKFPGCTEDQYTLMAMGDYNSYGSTKSCTVYNTAYDDLVLEAYRMYSVAAGYPQRPY